MLRLVCPPREKRAARAVSDPATDLHHDLLDGYVRDVIPMLAPSPGDADTNAVTLNLGVSLNYLAMEDEVLRSTAWLRMSWMDHRLSWDPEMYGGLQQIRVPASKIWTPDFEVSRGYLQPDFS